MEERQITLGDVFNSTLAKALGAIDRALERMDFDHLTPLSHLLEGLSCFIHASCGHEACTNCGEGEEQAAS